MSNPRVYGTFLDLDGIRHTISGVIDGVFSKKPGDWDSYTHCGMYSQSEPDTNPDLAPTCLKCITRVRTITLRADDGTPQGKTSDDAIIDEMHDIDVQKFLASRALRSRS